MNYSSVEYQCKNCHHIYAADVGITDVGITECPNCGAGKSMQKERKGSSLSTEKPETDSTMESEVIYERFEALNSYVKILKKVGRAVGITAFIPLLISAIFIIVTLVTFLDNDVMEYVLPPLVTCLTFLGISFTLFYAAGLLLIISELIQCFLAIEENTYQTAQNTSSLHQEVTDEP